jgi:hypothetical protein
MEHPWPSPSPHPLPVLSRLQALPLVEPIPVSFPNEFAAIPRSAFIVEVRIVARFVYIS